MPIIFTTHNFSGDFQTPATTVPMWPYDDTTTSPCRFLYHYGITMPPEYDVTTTPFSRSSSWKIASFPERFGVSEMVVPTSPTGFCSIFSGESDQYPKVEQDDYFCGNGGNSWVPYNPTKTSNWETDNQKTSKESEEPTLKIGRYSNEERRDKIMKYLKKRNQRNFNKTIKYECRKTLADKRVRVRGRFAKNNNNDHHNHNHNHNHNDHHEYYDHDQPCEDQVLPSINTANNPAEEEIQHLYKNNFLMKQDYDEEEEWLQQAMASLLY